jgi:hypothetical protein
MIFNQQRAPTMQHWLPDNRFLVVMWCSLVCTSCASNYSIEDPDFGSSVRYTIALQTESSRPGFGLDGEQAEAAMRTYKEFEKIDKNEVRTLLMPGN